MVLSPAMKTLQQAMTQLGSQLAAQYLSSVAGNETAINNLARAPQTLVSPVILAQRDLRPYDVPVAIAVLVVGLIYLCILPSSHHGRVWRKTASATFPPIPLVSRRAPYGTAHCLSFHFAHDLAPQHRV